MFSTMITRAVDDQAEVDRAEAHQVAGDPGMHHADDAPSIESGIASATISPARRLPSSTSSTTMTSTAALEQVLRHGARSRARSGRRGRRRRRSSTPSAAGSGSIASTFAFTRSTTSREFSPSSIMRDADDASPRPSRVDRAQRTARRGSPRAMSRDVDRRAARPRSRATTRPISSRSAISPSPRIDRLFAVALDVAAAARRRCCARWPRRHRPAKADARQRVGPRPAPRRSSARRHRC